MSKNIGIFTFRNELNPTSNDVNPFRYCAEYLDSETGQIYLRARYYQPKVGRFSQRDAHWNTANMIYGDEIKIKEYRDYLGLNTYTVKLIDYAAVRQSGNLYGYCLNNTLVYIDSNGEELFAVFVLGVVALTSIILTGCSMTSDEAKRRDNHNNSYNSSNFTVTLDTLTFSDKFNTSAYSTQISDRGWSNELIVSTINNPFKELKSAGYNKYTGNTVTYYYIDEDGYVAVDDGTHKVIQISDRNKIEWKNNDYQK